jgi:N-acetylmuramoyl-L-alanine amidase
MTGRHRPRAADAAAATWAPSQNFGARRGGARPVLVVLHYTAMASPEAALARLRDPAAEVSAHYLIGRDGRAWQLVAEESRAWHAGSGAWGMIGDVNSASLGVEIDNSGDAPFSEPAMARLEALLAEMLPRWGIGPGGVIGHADCAPGRKADPGPRFDWRRLARSGLALWPAAGVGFGADPGGDVADWLARAGYTAEAPLAARLGAFRARFRPGASGPPDAADRAILAALPPGPGMAAAPGRAG